MNTIKEFLDESENTDICVYVIKVPQSGKNILGWFHNKPTTKVNLLYMDKEELWTFSHYTCNDGCMWITPVEWSIDSGYNSYGVRHFEWEHCTYGIYNFTKKKFYELYTYEECWKFTRSILDKVKKIRDISVIDYYKENLNEE